MTSACPETFLFVPASDPRKIAKAITSTADVVILDLEDGVAPDQKQSARHLLARTLATQDPSAVSRYAVRVNQTDTTDIDADLDTLDRLPHGPVILPKVQGPEEVADLAERLTDTPRGEPQRIIASIETPTGVLAAAAIARAHPKVWALMFGSGDYCAALGILESPSRAELDYPRAHIALAASAAGLLAIDAPFYQGINDLGALRADTARGRQLGYHAKACIHPKHLATIREVHAPAAEQVEWADRVLSAYRAAQQQGTAALTVASMLIDAPVVAQAQRIIEHARQSSARQNRECNSVFRPAP